jgi:hypothetical protein
VHPTACGCRPDALSLWIGKVFSCLVAKPSFGGVTALTGHHAMTVRLGPRALGPMVPSLMTPCGGGAEFTPYLSSGVNAPMAVSLALVEKVQVPMEGGGIVSTMHVEGEFPLSPDIKGVGV